MKKGKKKIERGNSRDKRFEKSISTINELQKSLHDLTKEIGHANKTGVEIQKAIVEGQESRDTYAGLTSTLAIYQLGIVILSTMAAVAALLQDKSLLLWGAVATMILALIGVFKSINDSIQRKKRKSARERVEASVLRQPVDGPQGASIAMSESRTPRLTIVMVIATCVMAFFASVQSLTIGPLIEQANAAIRQTDELTKQTHFITRPAKIEIAINLTDERGTGYRVRTGDRVDLVLANTGAQLAVLKRVEILWARVNWSTGKLEQSLFSELIPFPTKVIGANDWIPHKIQLPPHFPLPEGTFEKPDWIHYRIQVHYYNNSTSLDFSERWFDMHWYQKAGECRVNCEP